MKNKSILLLVALLRISSLEAEDKLETPNQLEARGWRLEERNRGTDQEVAAGDYCSFLNVVASSDGDCLYNENMESLVRTGEPASYHYDVVQGKEDCAINFGNQENATRYSDWKGTSISTNSFKIDASLRSNHITYQNQHRYLTI